MGKANNAHSWLASVVSGGRGLRAARPAGDTPERPLEIYEFESCPYCRKVRETVSELDLEYISRTTPHGSKTRDELRARGGKVMVPYLVDPNTDTAMYESEDIIDYLHRSYGNTERSPAWRAISALNTLRAGLASLVRPLGGKAQVRRERQPDQLLELYNFEASPYCRKVREALNALDLDYRARNVAKRSARRPELVNRGGKMRVPYLIDPNTDTEMYESDDIVRYLWATYG